MADGMTKQASKQFKSWNHPMCLPCWRRKYIGQDPTRVLGYPMENCCWCGRQTTHGIFIREDSNAIIGHKDHV